MKKNFLFVFLGLSLIAATVACEKKEKPKEEVVLEAKQSVRNDLPALNVSQVDNQKVSFKDLKGKVLLVFFNPDCDHCQRQGQMIANNRPMLEGYETYFVSPDSIQAIEKYSKEYKLEDPTIHFAHAEGMDIYNAIGPITNLPTYFVYNNQALVARTDGEISSEKLKQILK